MSKILVTGSNGQLGSQIRELTSCRHDMIYTDIPQLDICNIQELLRITESEDISTIINCAAYTDVEKAEIEPDKAFRLNGEGVSNLTRVAKERKIGLIHISTDFVFNGESNRPYIEADLCNPISTYGKSKFAGEVAIRNSGCKSIIIRTSWLYSKFGDNFYKRILESASGKDNIEVVNDQIGTPTSATDLATAILNIIPQLESKPLYGEVFHFSNEGVCSRYDFAKKILELHGSKCRIIPVSTSRYTTKAKRPLYSVLSKEHIRKTFGVNTPHWEDAFKEVYRTRQQNLLFNL